METIKTLLLGLLAMIILGIVGGLIGIALVLAANWALDSFVLIS